MTNLAGDHDDNSASPSRLLGLINQSSLQAGFVPVHKTFN